jgi:hypothetical protein
MPLGNSIYHSPLKARKVKKKRRPAKFQNRKGTRPLQPTVGRINKNCQTVFNPHDMPSLTLAIQKEVNPKRSTFNTSHDGQRDIPG